MALAVAAVFAGLAQWQADRSFRFVPKAPVTQTSVELGKLAESSSPFQVNQADRLVTLTAGLMPGVAYIIENRIQLDGNGGSKTGFWLVRPATTDQGKRIYLAFGWYPSLAEAKQASPKPDEMLDMALYPYSGLYEPSEEPRPKLGSTFQSLAISQLINQPREPASVDAYSGFVIVKLDGTAPQQIIIGNNPGENTFNWLTAFYAAEWALFAGFAIFLWGRLVKDAVLAEKRAE